MKKPHCFFCDGDNTETEGLLYDPCQHNGCTSLLVKCLDCGLEWVADGGNDEGQNDPV